MTDSFPQNLTLGISPVELGECPVGIGDSMMIGQRNFAQFRQSGHAVLLKRSGLIDEEGSFVFAPQDEIETISGDAGT